MLTEFLIAFYILTGFYIPFGIVLPLVSVLLLRSAGVKFDVWQRSLFVFTFLVYASWYATGIVLATAGAHVEIVILALYLWIVASGVPWSIIAYKCGLYVKYSGHEVVYKYPAWKGILIVILSAVIMWFWVFAPIWLVEYSWHRSRHQKEIRKIYAKLEAQPKIGKRKRTWGEVAGEE
jgi:hypothetical protein